MDGLLCAPRSGSLQENNMIASRRAVLFGVLAAGAPPLPGSMSAFAQAGVPNAASFQSGDLLWPKKPGAFVPYDYQPDSTVERDRERWTQEKNTFVERARTSGNPELMRTANEVAPLSYNEFRAIYLDGQTPGQMTTYGLDSTVSVGHIAIVELDTTGRPWVIEALWNPGVVRTPYDTWLKNRPGEIVWHGRLKGFTPDKCAMISFAAKQYLGARYDFWNFNLADTKGFYCSKLSWLSIMRALQFAIDDNPQPSRTIWLSPKQILNSKNVVRLLVPVPSNFSDFSRTD